MQRQKEPLFRKVNTKARGVHHNFGTDYKNTKGTKKAPSTKMEQGIRRGLDYTPLFKFLLSKVGCRYDDVYSEAVSRLDTPEPISRIVFKDKDGSDGYFRNGESTYFSTLYIDSDGLLQLVNPSLNADNLPPSCNCCTHTFNGRVFTKKFK